MLTQNLPDLREAEDLKGCLKDLEARMAELKKASP
jgi:hypothetical protein